MEVEALVGGRELDALVGVRQQLGDLGEEARGDVAAQQADEALDVRGGVDLACSGLGLGVRVRVRVTVRVRGSG